MLFILVIEEENPQGTLIVVIRYVRYFHKIITDYYFFSIRLLARTKERCVIKEHFIVYIIPQLNLCLFFYSFDVVREELESYLSNP